MDLGILKTESHTFPIYLFSLIIITDKYFMASKDLFHEMTNVTDRNHLFSYLSWKICLDINNERGSNLLTTATLQSPAFPDHFLQTCPKVPS